MFVYRNFRPSKLTSLLVVLLLTSIHLHNSQAQNSKHEMRGIWVATVSNIDWPSSNSLKSKTQKREAIELLNHVKSLGFNTIFLQVRPTTDALYNSSLEPWSSVLTPVAGQAPKPFYDPLQFWIDEAHQRGIELHAWINPYRAAMNADTPLPDNHPAIAHPEWFLTYGGKLYFDPGQPASKHHINKVVKEIIKNYEVDGIHMDDYFYPYPIAGIEFPDSLSYNKYGKANFPDNKDDWRRENVNQTIESLYQTIKTEKPWVAFGISPFGVWRNQADDPRGSDSRAGATNYDHLYADILKWMENGWMDYVAPQIYWETSHPAANFVKLAQWWNDNNYETPVFIGHGTYKIGSDKPDWQSPQQMPQQFRIGRSLPNINGNISFSYKHFKRDLLGFQDSLANHLFNTVALPPAYELKPQTTPDNPIIKIKATGRRVKWKLEKSSQKENYRYVIYSYAPNQQPDYNDPSLIVDITGLRKYKFIKRKNGKRTVNYIRVSTIDKNRRESRPSAPVRVKL